MYTNMQPDWPLRSVIIYCEQGRIMGKYSKSISVELNSGMLLKKISNQWVVFALNTF